jgi:hypothetical protein
MIDNIISKIKDLHEYKTLHPETIEEINKYLNTISDLTKGIEYSLPMDTESYRAYAFSIDIGILMEMILIRIQDRETRSIINAFLDNIKFTIAHYIDKYHRDKYNHKHVS